MIIWFAFLIPVLVLLGAMVFIGRKMHWWEPVLLCGVCLLASGIGSSVSEANQTRATEFYGGMVTSAEYIEPWNEWITKTCTQCVARDTAGRCTQEVEYDCSYCDEHAEDYNYETTIGSGFANANEVWNVASVQFGQSFVDLGRNSQCANPRNGNKWEAQWNGDSATMLPYFASHSYENRVQAAPTLFSFKEIDPAKVRVFNYPKNAGIDQSSILTDTKLVNQAKANDLLNYYNGKYGASKQVHAYLIVFKNREPEAGRDQEAYWKGAGKNELVTTVGVDNDGNITWAYVFSWSKDKMSSIVIRDSLMRMKKLDAYQAVELIGQEGVKKFSRRQFSEFSYITVQPSNTATVIIYIIALLLSIAWVIFKKVEIDSEGTETGLFFDRLNPAHRIVRNRNRSAPWE